MNPLKQSTKRMHTSDSLLSFVARRFFWLGAIVPDCLQVLSRAQLVRASLVVAASFAVLPWYAAAPALAQSSGTTAVEDIATGGPFFLSSRRRQRFAAQFTMGADDLNKPLTLILHNGIGGRPGLNWARVFIGPDMNLDVLKSAEEPSANLLFDENYLERHTVSIDLSDKVVEGVNTIILEGTGPKGGVISWVVEGPATPEFAAINPTTSQPGGRLTLSGRGFSLDASQNKVTINGSEAEIVSASRNSLTIKLPIHLSAGPAQVIVTTNNVSSAPYAISIVNATP